MERKMAKWVRAAFIPAVGLCISAPAVGAGDAHTKSQSAVSAKASQANTYRALRASQLIGKDVKSPQGKNLGEIEDLIVDMQSGKVRYAILKFDPGLFSGERLFAVPTNELKVAGGKDEFVYNMSRERLEKAGVEKSRWPGAVRDREYLAELDRNYAVVQPSGDRRAYSASELLGKDVNSRQGNGIGEIRDLVIDMNGQNVRYAVLAFDPGWTAPEKLYAFPLRAFGFTDGKDELVLDVDRSRVQAMKNYDHTLWSSFNKPDFIVDIERYLVTWNEKGNSTTAGSANYSASMTRLQNAAQKLRESIQAMAQAPVGDRRNQAIKEARHALNDTNQAMMQLPPELRAAATSSKGATAATGTTSSAGGTGSTASSGSQQNYSESMTRLQQSADQLRKAIQAMAQQPVGDRRNQAINEAQQALYDTNAAMAQLPPELRTK